MQLVSRSLCVCAACVCLLALVAGGLAWGWARLDGILTERDLRGFVRQVLTQSSDGRWAEVRSVASRDAVDGLERHHGEWSWSAEPAIDLRSLAPGAWVLWVKTRRGDRYHLQVDDMSWRPLTSPWRRRTFRMTSFEKIG